MLAEKGAASALGRLGIPSSRVQSNAALLKDGEGVPAGWTQSPGITLPTTRCLMPTALAVTSSRPGLGPRDRELEPQAQTPARDRWLNPSWTLSLGGTLNRPRDATLEGLSGWIRTGWRAARAQCRARADRVCAPRAAAGGDLDGSH